MTNRQVYERLSAEARVIIADWFTFAAAVRR